MPVQEHVAFNRQMPFTEILAVVEILNLHIVPDGTSEEFCDELRTDIEVYTHVSFYLADLSCSFLFAVDRCPD